jgi:hypothetical protein
MIRFSPLRALSPICLVAMLVGCSNVPADAQKNAEAAPVSPQVVGGDRDAHGCLPSAGYQWCERENACVRPWELAREAGFENTADGFRNHCDAKAKAEKPADGNI